MQRGSPGPCAPEHALLRWRYRPPVPRRACRPDRVLVYGRWWVLCVRTPSVVGLPKLLEAWEVLDVQLIVSTSPLCPPSRRGGGGTPNAKKGPTPASPPDSPHPPQRAGARRESPRPLLPQLFLLALALPP